MRNTERHASTYTDTDEIFPNDHSFPRDSRPPPSPPYGLGASPPMDLGTLGAESYPRTCAVLLDLSLASQLRSTASPRNASLGRDAISPSLACSPSRGGSATEEREHDGVY